MAAPARSLAHATFPPPSDAARHRASDAVVFGQPLSTVGWLPVVPRYMVHGTFGTPEAGTRTPYVQCVTPRGKLPCASGTYSMQEAGTRSSYVQYGGPGTYV